MIIGALSTGHKLGLGLAGLAFIVFALSSAFLLPRARENFPGRGLRTFVVVCFLFFVGMMAAVLVFGREEESKAAEGVGTEEALTAPATTAAGNAARQVRVSLVDFKIKLSTGTTLSEGKYVLVVANDGKAPHNLTIKGPNNPTIATPTFGGGKQVRLQAALTPGTYELYCSVPGHKEAGMDVEVKVSS